MIGTEPALAPQNEATEKRSAAAAGPALEVHNDLKKPREVCSSCLAREFTGQSYRLAILRCRSFTWRNVRAHISDKQTSAGLVHVFMWHSVI
jgi:hypothetical protein